MLPKGVCRGRKKEKEKVGVGVYFSPTSTSHINTIVFSFINSFTLLHACCSCAWKGQHAFVYGLCHLKFWLGLPKAPLGF